MSGAQSTRVAVIGLGSMGFGIASSLRRAGFEVVGCDVNRAAVAQFQREGGLGVYSPAEASTGAAAVFSVVVNAAQTEAVLFGADGCAAAMAEQSLFVSCATMSPADARELAKRIESGGILYLDAPISGGAQRAATGELTVLTSGSPAAVERARPYLAALAAKVFELGAEPGTAAAFKMINQLLAGVHIAAAAEAIAMARKLGLDARQVYDVITVSAGNSWMFQDRIQHVLDDDYRPRSAVGIFVKDLGIIMDMAREQKIAAPIAATALQMFLMTAAAGMDKDDDASVARLYAQLMGTTLHE